MHIVEEYVGGFARWVTLVVGGSMNASAFAVNNAVFMAILVALTAWTSRSRTAVAAFFLIVWSSANLFWDALFHLVMTPLYDRYSPGLVTAILLYLPLSVLVGAAALREHFFTTRTFVYALVAGALLFTFVVWAGLYHFAV